MSIDGVWVALAGLAPDRGWRVTIERVLTVFRSKHQYWTWSCTIERWTEGGGLNTQIQPKCLVSVYTEDVDPVQAIKTAVAEAIHSNCPENTRIYEASVQQVAAEAKAMQAAYVAANPKTEPDDLPF